MKTTAIYKNRIRDKERVELQLGLNEFGDENTKFYTKNDTLIFIGYVRIVFGDHGPYVEFEESHLVGTLKNKFNSTTPKDSYYEWKTVDDSSDIKIYWQLRDVKNLKNPPYPGYKGNRKEGYADYIPEKFYISPYQLKFQPNKKEKNVKKEMFKL